eukprot:TRINITY_DN9791_c0_g1_i1.p1 TRINITY_DN9791_c0_g1~~TRINITY_DN9791_c0_g1_i1.p1  ORF type:complete len:389 (-),score=119.88 TRINITY_DN9791_c0_g1_i1:274-1440(-)
MCIALEFVRRVAVVLLYLLLALLHFIEIPFSLLGSLLYVLFVFFVCCVHRSKDDLPEVNNGDEDVDEEKQTITMDKQHRYHMTTKKGMRKKRREVPPFLRARLNWFCVKLLFFCLYTYFLPWSHPLANRFDFHHLSYGVAFLLLHPFERILRFGQWMTFDSIVNYDAVGIFGWRKRLFFSLDWSPSFGHPPENNDYSADDNDNNNNDDGERKPSYAFPSIDDLSQHHRDCDVYSLKTSPSYVFDRKGRLRFVRKSDGTLEQISKITFYLDSDDDDDDEEAGADERDPNDSDETSNSSNNNKLKRKNKNKRKKRKGNAFPADNFFVDYWSEFLLEMFGCRCSGVLLEAVTEKKDEIIDRVVKPEYEKIIRHPELRQPQPLLHVPFDIFK